MTREGLVRSLRENEVRFVLIGASALPVHGITRATADIDIFIEPTIENAERTHRTLVEFGYDLTDVEPQDLLEYKVLVEGYIVEADVHPFVTGIAWEEVWQDKVSAKFGEVEAHFPSFEHLVRMKEAAARPRDLEDLKMLLEVKPRREEQNP